MSLEQRIDLERVTNAFAGLDPKQEVFIAALGEIHPDSSPVPATLLMTETTLKDLIARMRFAWLTATADHRSNDYATRTFLDIRRDTAEMYPEIWNNIGQNLIRADVTQFVDTLAIVRGRKAENGGLFSESPQWTGFLESLTASLRDAHGPDTANAVLVEMQKRNWINADQQQSLAKSPTTTVDGGINQIKRTHGK